MRPNTAATVHGPDGLRGTVVAESGRGGEAGSRVAVRLDNGRLIGVPEDRLVLQADQTYLLRLTGSEADEPRVDGMTGDAPVASADVAVGERTETVVPRIVERLVVGKADVGETIRIRKTVHEREEVVDPPLARETVEVERVPVNRVVDVAPAVRHEGDVTIVPVLEEVLVVEKRLVLREELRVTRRRAEVREPQRVTLRSEQVEVERAASAPAGPDAAGGAVPTRRDPLSPST